MRITESPDESVVGGILEVNYHEDKTFSIEFEKKFWKRSCLLPLIGKLPNFETKAFIIEDPKLDSHFFFNFISDTKIWVFGSLNTMLFAPINLEEFLNTSFNLGDTKIKFFSQLDYIKKKKKFNVSFIPATPLTEPINQSDNLSDFDIENFFKNDFDDGSCSRNSSSSSSLEN